MNIIGGWRWQLEYKSEYLLFSSYRQAAWSERMTSCLSILFICCHFLRWKPLLCQIPIDRVVCNACDSDDQFWSKGGILPIGQPSCHILGFFRLLWSKPDSIAVSLFGNMTVVAGEILINTNADWPTKKAIGCHILGCLISPPLSDPSSSGGREADAKAVHQGELQGEQ